MPPRCSVGVLGGGMLGLTLALRLRAQGHDVTVIEGAATPGGLAGAQALGGHRWDRFYHVVSPCDKKLLGLLEELSVSDRVRWRSTRTGFYTDGKLYSMSSSLEFLRFPPLSLVDKFRLAATIVYASRIREWKHLEAVHVTDWLRKFSGKRTFERMWLPLLKAKLGENYRQASAAFIWAIIARMYAARSSGMKREMFGYLAGGYEPVIGVLRNHLETLGVEIACGSPAAEIRDVGQGAEVELADGSVRSFDRLVVTLPASRVAALCPQMSPSERDRLSRIVYQGVVCASMLLRRPLAGYYVTNITDDWVPFTAVVEMTALVDRASFGGQSLVYLPRYLVQDDPFWRRTDADIKEEFITALERMYPDFRRDDITAFQVARARDVLAVSTLNYSDTLRPALTTSLPNVYLATSAQIANGTLNVNETIGIADAQAVELAPLLASANRVGVSV